MCATCGCSEGTRTRITDPAEPDHVHSHEGDGHHAHSHEHGDHDHSHHHDHDHPHPHDHDQAEPVQGKQPRTLRLEQDLLEKNDRIAEWNRGWLEGRNIVAWNLMSSPGAGKTTLLERMIRGLGREMPLSVVEGDQETLNDSERIRATGCRVVQVNTGSGCHLDAEMLRGALRRLDPPADSVVLIENVGNLVCPALFDLGERAKVVIASVTEGEDKPLKYPHMFRASSVMLLNKVDLLEHLDFDVEACLAYARRVNPRLRIFQVSATRGDGLDEWYDFVRQEIRTPAVTAV